MSLPIHLSANEAKGLVLQEPIAQFEIGSMKNFIYLILDWETKKAAIVDPQKDLSAPLQALAQNGFELTGILLTHSHFDHTAGVGPLLELYPHISIRMGELDLHRLQKSTQSVPGLKVITEGEELKVGNLSVRAIHTPGHSAGEFCFFLKSKE